MLAYHHRLYRLFLIVAAEILLVHLLQEGTGTGGGARHLVVAFRSIQPARKLPVATAITAKKKGSNHVDEVTTPAVERIAEQDDVDCNARRNVLRSVLGASSAAASAAVVSSSSNSNKASAASSTITSVQPLVDLPMTRLRLPRGGLGRDYVALPLKINGRGPYDFMLDTGLTTEFLTPHLKEQLGIATPRGTGIQGLGAGGGTQNQYLVELKGASLGDLDLPTLTAVVTDFPQEHIDPKHDPVEGMLGMELLSLFDVDFDFPKNRIRFYPPGSLDMLVKQDKNLITIPAVVINETGLIGIRLTTPGHSQPVVAFLDCGSSFSAVNWQAAEILGLPAKNDPVYRKNPGIMAVGVDGSPLTLPTYSQQFTFTGDALQSARGQLVGFEQPPNTWKPWNPVQVAIGDIPAFQTVLGDGIRPYLGPAALVGLDVLSQRRVIFEAGAGKKTRLRRVVVSSS